MSVPECEHMREKVASSALSDIFMCAILCAGVALSVFAEGHSAWGKASGISMQLCFFGRLQAHSIVYYIAMLAPAAWLVASSAALATAAYRVPASSRPFMKQLLVTRSLFFFGFGCVLWSTLLILYLLTDPGVFSGFTFLTHRLPIRILFFIEYEYHALAGRLLVIMPIAAAALVVVPVLAYCFPPRHSQEAAGETR